MSHVGCEGVVGMCVESFGVARIIVCLACSTHLLIGWRVKQVVSGLERGGDMDCGFGVVRHRESLLQ